jgi:hypothetical protein
MSHMQKVFCALIIPFVVVSCGCPSSPSAEPEEAGIFVPGEDSIAALAFGSGRYYVARVPKEYVPEPVPVQGDQPTPPAAITNEHGAIAFRDPAYDATLAAVIVDTDGQPVSGLRASYFKTDETITIVVSDPQRQYAPLLLAVDPADVEIASGPDVIIEDYPITITVIVGTVAKLWMTATLAKATCEILELEDAEVMNLEDIVAGSDGFEYDCASPELFMSRLKPGVTLAFLLVPAPGGKEAAAIIAHGVDFAVGGKITEQVGKLSNQPDQPVLLRRHIYSESDGAPRLEWTKGLTESEIQELEVWEQVGECAFVPDLVGMSWLDASQKLDALGLEWVTVDENGESVDKRSIGLERLDIVAQEPPPTHESEFVGGQAPNMLPVGAIDGYEPLQVTVETFRRTYDEVEYPWLLTEADVPDGWYADVVGSEPGSYLIWFRVKNSGQYVLGFHVAEFETSQEATERFDESLVQAAGTTQMIEEKGDRAYWQSVGGYTSIQVLKGRYVITVGGMSDDDPSPYLPYVDLTLGRFP